MLNAVTKWVLSHLVPIYAGQTWKDKQKERYYRVVSVGKDFVVCNKMFFGTRHVLDKKEFRRALYLIV
jgi:hypothetical protein